MFIIAPHVEETFLDAFSSAPEEGIAHYQECLKNYKNADMQEELLNLGVKGMKDIVDKMNATEKNEEANQFLPAELGLLKTVLHYAPKGSEASLYAINQGYHLVRYCIESKAEAYYPAVVDLMFNLSKKSDYCGRSMRNRFINQTYDFKQNCKGMADSRKGVLLAARAQRNIDLCEKKHPVTSLQHINAKKKVNIFKSIGRFLTRIGEALRPEQAFEIPMPMMTPSLQAA